MEIETQELTACEVAPDGCAISLGFIDSKGEPATIRLLLDPARTAKRTRRSVDGSSSEGDDTVELAARCSASLSCLIVAPTICETRPTL